MGSEVALAALGIVATIAGALVWLLKKLFEQNTGTLSSLAQSLDHNTDAMVSLKDSLTQRDTQSTEVTKKIVSQLESQEKVLHGLSQTQLKISRVQDKIAAKLIDAEA